MSVRDRITELRRVRAGELRPHPLNWRAHPENQRAALEAVLDEVGYADALLARELPDGALQLIDGHLRAQTTPDEIVPVLVVDLDEAEAEKVLLTHDPLAGLAETDQQALGVLLGRVETANRAFSGLLETIAAESGKPDFRATDALPGVELPETYQVVVECSSEAEQREVYETMRKEGRKCRVLTL